ncbi:hypothetical protein HU200_019327 [Digitaria exilis]|uniref:DUF1618 domain-containing protein n=1 Tax=Digitaria exilis TaxID=1010633 RepID=A0A835F373_9POAL|nr:hypothetical protein HU200_019327 [Digitaria exilis]
MEKQFRRSTSPYLASAPSPATFLASGSLESPWLIIGRYVRVAAMEAQAAVDAEPAMEAQAEEMAAVDAEPAMEAQAAVDAEPAMEAQAEEMAAVDAEPQASEDVVNADAAHAMAVPDFTLLVARRPEITILAAGRGAHPDPNNPDGSPYIIAADPHGGLLVHFTGGPSDHLVVVRRFCRTAEGETAASAEHVPMQAIDIEKVAFLCAGSNYEIAVLQVPNPESSSQAATLMQFKSSGDGWVTTRPENPLPAQERRRRMWSPHGAVSIASTLWWFDLSWGIVSYDSDCNDSRPRLIFHRLPHDRSARNGEMMKNIQRRRCITASQNKLIYAEIIPTATGEAAKLSMWSRSRVQGRWLWDKMYTMSFDEIWGDESYKRTELPRNVPALAVVSPSNPGLVYFALEEDIFGVNIPARKVVHYEAYKLVQPRIASGRYVAAWSLQFQPAIAQGSPLRAQRLQEQGVLLADVPESSGGRTQQQTGMALESVERQLEGSALGTNQTLEEAPRLQAPGHLDQLVQRIASGNTLALGEVSINKLLSVETVGAHGVIGVISPTAFVDSSAGKIKEVWCDEVEAVFEEISTILRDQGDEMYLVAFDTEFAIPDGLGESKGAPQTPDGHYQQLCDYVNTGDLVQMGLAFADKHYNVVGGKVFQFNIHFDPEWRQPNHSGVKFMVKSGLNLKEHAIRGIEVGRFVELLSASGAFRNNKLSWITFMGYIDFGHLIKLLSGNDLPASREDFLDQFRAIFPCSYDCKVFSKFGKCIEEPVPGALARVASKL